MASQNVFWRRRDAAVRRSARFLRALFQQERQLPVRQDQNRNLARSEDGESLVAFALCLPILVGFVFGLMEVCMAYYTHESLSELAREGTRYAIVRGSTCETSTNTSCTTSVSGIETYVSGLNWPNVGGGTVSVTASYPDGNEAPGSRVEVNMTYVFPYTIPFVTSQSLSLSSTSEMYIIQ